MSAGFDGCGGPPREDLILHYRGVYCLYSTARESPVFTEGLTRNQLEALAPKGGNGLPPLQVRINRAHRTGSSSRHGLTLEEAILFNRAGDEGQWLSIEAFIRRYLTLPPE